MAITDQDMLDYSRTMAEAKVATEPLQSVIPPLGLRPKAYHDNARAQEILSAMLRYLQAGQKVPAMWVSELSDLLSN